MTVDSEDDIRWENDCWNMLEPSKINSKFMRLDYPTWNIFNILWEKTIQYESFLSGTLNSQEIGQIFSVIKD